MGSSIQYASDVLHKPQSCPIYSHNEPYRYQDLLTVYEQEYRSVQDLLKPEYWSTGFP